MVDYQLFMLRTSKIHWVYLMFRNLWIFYSAYLLSPHVNIYSLFRFLYIVAYNCQSSARNSRTVSYNLSYSRSNGPTWPLMLTFKVRLTPIEIAPTRSQSSKVMIYSVHLYVSKWCLCLRNPIGLMVLVWPSN